MLTTELHTDREGRNDFCAVCVSIHSLFVARTHSALQTHYRSQGRSEPLKTRGLLGCSIGACPVKDPVVCAISSADQHTCVLPDQNQVLWCSLFVKLNADRLVFRVNTSGISTDCMLAECCSCAHDHTLSAVCHAHASLSSTLWTSPQQHV